MDFGLRRHFEPWDCQFSLVTDPMKDARNHSLQALLLFFTLMASMLSMYNSVRAIESSQILIDVAKYSGPGGFRLRMKGRTQHSPWMSLIFSMRLLFKERSPPMISINHCTTCQIMLEYSKCR